MDGWIPMCMTEGRCSPSEYHLTNTDLVLIPGWYPGLVVGMKNFPTSGASLLEVADCLALVFARVPGGGMQATSADRSAAPCCCTPGPYGFSSSNASSRFKLSLPVIIHNNETMTASLLLPLNPNPKFAMHLNLIEGKQNTSTNYRGGGAIGAGSLDPNLEPMPSHRGPRSR